MKKEITNFKTTKISLNLPTHKTPTKHQLNTTNKTPTKHQLNT